MHLHLASPKCVINPCLQSQTTLITNRSNKKLFQVTLTEMLIFSFTEQNTLGTGEMQTSGFYSWLL